MTQISNLSYHPAFQVLSEAPPERSVSDVVSEIFQTIGTDVSDSCKTFTNTFFVSLLDMDTETVERSIEHKKMLSKALSYTMTALAIFVVIAAIFTPAGFPVGAGLAIGALFYYNSQIRSDIAKAESVLRNYKNPGQRYSYPSLREYDIAHVTAQIQRIESELYNLQHARPSNAEAIAQCQSNLAHLRLYKLALEKDRPSKWFS